MPRTLLFLFFVFQVFLSHAEGITEEDFLSEMPVVLSASRLNQPLDEAPSAVTVIDRETIRASGYRQIADLFRLVPGFYVSYFNGHHPVVSYHGMSDQYSRRMQVLVDGRSIYMPPTGSVDWSSLPITVDDIERIEVVRGASAASHGANSFLGVISITTRNPALEYGVAGSLTGGANGTGDGFFRYGGKSDNLDYRFALGYRSDNGFAKVNDSNRINLVNLSADYDMTPADLLQIRLGDAHGQQGLGDPGNTGTVNPSDPPRNSMVTNEFESVRWVRSRDAGNDISVLFYHNYQRLSDAYLTLPGLVPGGAVFPVDAGITGRRYHLEYQQSYSMSPTFRNLWGGSVRLDESFAPLYMKGHLEEPSQSVFWHGEWRVVPKLVINVGAMLERNDYIGKDVSPQVALNYHLSRSNTVRMSFSKAVRAPAMFEQKGELVYVLGKIVVPRFYGPGNLRPEKVRSRDIGYIGDFFDSAIVLDARLYQDHFDDLITTSATSFPRTFGNFGTADERGAEIQLKWKPAKASQITANLSHSNISGNFVESYNQSAPKNNLTLFAMHRFSSVLDASCVYTRQGDVRALGDGQLVNGFSRFDFRLARSFHVERKRAEVALVVQNLLNTPYSEFRTLNVFDRQVYLTLNFGM